MKFNDFMRFAEAKVKNHACPVCEQSAGWTAIGARGDDGRPKPVPGFAYFKTTDDDVVDDMHLSIGLPTIQLECKNCGYLRGFSTRVMRRWVEGNPVFDEEESPENDKGSEDHAET